MRTALVVEDDAVTRAGMAALLTSLFSIDRVVEATNGHDALRRLSRPVDVVITDISMPDMDGVELIQEIRKRGSDVPIIVVSGHADFDYAREALRQGATDYLLKPVDRMELGRALTQCGVMRDQDDPLHGQGVTNVAIARAIDYIDRNIDSDLSLGTVAEAVALSRQYLSSLFHQQTGSTFVDYITARRIERARHLLATTDLRVYEVASMSGYRNAKTFMTTFRDSTGVSALEYRTRHLTSRGAPGSPSS